MMEGNIEMANNNKRVKAKTSKHITKVNSTLPVKKKYKTNLKVVKANIDGFVKPVSAITTSNENQSILTALSNIAYLVHIKLFDKSVEYCDGCRTDYNANLNIISSFKPHLLEEFKHYIQNSIHNDRVCHKHDCFVGNMLKFTLFHFNKVCSDITYGSYKNVAPNEEMVLDAIREFVITYM